MANSKVVGSVARIWRFPVKSMRGEQLQQGEFTERGLVGDRAYALLDVDPAGYRDAVVEQKLGSVFFAEAGLFPCVGVYAVVQAPGTLQTGDSVSLT